MEDVLAIRDEYRLQKWSQIIQAGQNSGLSIYAMGHFPDRSPGAVQGLNGATMLLENVGSYVLVGVICFIAAVVVTVFCTRLRKKNNKQEERTKEDEEA